MKEGYDSAPSALQCGKEVVPFRNFNCSRIMSAPNHGHFRREWTKRKSRFTIKVSTGPGGIQTAGLP